MNEVVIFKRNKTTGALIATGKKIALCAPVCLVLQKVIVVGFTIKAKMNIILAFCYLRFSI
jgi:hypothetical protein